MNNTSVRTLPGHESIRITAEFESQRPAVFMLHGGQRPPPTATPW
jgi:hypothetical protein